MPRRPTPPSCFVESRPIGAPALIGGLLVATALLPGCGSVSAERGHDQVASIVEQRTGHPTGWEKGSPDGVQIADRVRELTARGLTRARAVEVALVNNPELQATYEELGVSQADMVQAGLLRNPAFGADFGFRINSGHTDELRLSLVQDFLDLFVLPMRKEIARGQFEADTLRVAHRALEVAAAVEKAFVAAEASVELVTFRRTLVDAAAAAADLSQRQFAAGNVSELERASGAATYQQARLELAREELGLLEARETVNRLLGLSGEATAWRFAEALPPLPDTEATVDHLEALALSQRLDVAVARRQAALLSKAVEMARSTRFVGRLEIGVDMHQDPNGPRLLGPNLVIELPIFDQRQAVIARLEAQQRQQQRRLSGVAIDAGSEVRLAEGRLRTNREIAVHYRDRLATAAQPDLRTGAAALQRDVHQRLPAAGGEAGGGGGAARLPRGAARLLAGARRAGARGGRRATDTAAAAQPTAPVFSVVVVAAARRARETTTMSEESKPKSKTVTDDSIARTERSDATPPPSRRAILVGATVGGALLARAGAAAPAPAHAPEKGLPPGRPGRDYPPVSVPNGAKLPWKLVDGVKVFHLVAEEVEHELAPGLKARCWGYNGRVHGPVIEAVEGRSRAHLRHQPPAGADDRALARNPGAERDGRRRRSHPEGDPARRDVQVRVHAAPARHGDVSLAPRRDDPDGAGHDRPVRHPPAPARAEGRPRLRDHAARVAHRSRRASARTRTR